MLAYPWSGNVRELQNLVKRAVLLAETPLLEMRGLDMDSISCGNEGTTIPAVLPLKDDMLEKERIVNALSVCNGHREQAARMLNINPATLYRKMKKHGIK